MPDRWWDPDSAPVALLESSGDQRLDIANALIQVHRSGAAALQVAAETPLVDDHTVRRALDEARQAYADPVIDAVSKSMPSQVYAGLYVRDVADDAEQAAMRVYYACVSKQVPPPVAAQRAAAVYGVPASELGQYVRLATEPRASAVALTDLADRALFGWVAASSGAETETIAKAESAARRRDVVADEARDESGHWTTAGPEEVAVVQPERRQLRAQRAKRAQRAQRAQRAVGRLIPKRALEKTRLTKTKLSKDPMAREKLQRMVLGTQQRLEVAAAEANKSRVPRDLEVDPHVFTGPVVDPRLDNDVSFVMPYDEWAHFRAKTVNKTTNRTAFSGAALNDWIGAGHYVDSQAHAETLAGIAAKIEADPEFQDTLRDEVFEVHPEDAAYLEQISTNSDIGEYNQVLNRMKRNYLETFLQAEGLDVRDYNITDEVGHIEQAWDADDPQESLLFVWHQPRPDGSKVRNRRKVSIADVQLDAEGAHGTVQQGSRYGAESVQLDPNLPIEFRHSGFYDRPPRGHYDDNVVTYDKNLGAFVTRVYISVGEQRDVSKAAPARAHYDPDEPRDAEGKWTGDTADVTPVRREERAARAVRAKRASRAPSGTGRLIERARLEKTALSRAALPKAKLEKARLQLQAARSATKNARGNTHVLGMWREMGGVPLDDSETYVLVGQNDLHQLGLDEHAEREHHLNPEQSSWLLNQDGMLGDEVQWEATQMQTHISTSGALTDRLYESTQDGFNHLVADVAHAMRRGDSVEVQLERIVVNDEMRIRGTVYDRTVRQRDTNRVAPLQVLRWNAGDAGTYKLEWNGQYRLLDPTEVTHILSMNWHDTLNASSIELTDNSFPIYNPLVDSWDINHPDRSR